jgi:hypothetical protein
MTAYVESDSDGIAVLVNVAKEVDTMVNSQQQVRYDHFTRDSYVTFFDDGENEATFSVAQLDDLIEALEYIKNYHVRREADNGTL